MRILTWNVYFGGHMFEERADALVAELLRRRPEVIALQEVTLELLQRLGGLADAGYESSDEGGATLGYGYGVMLFARVPVRGFRFVDLPTDMGRTLISTELGSGLTVATVHLESIDVSRPVRLAQLAVIQERLARRDDVVWVGDMNFLPDDLEQAALDPSWTDVWPALHRPTPATPSIPISTRCVSSSSRRRPTSASTACSSAAAAGTRARSSAWAPRRSISRGPSSPITSGSRSTSPNDDRAAPRRSPRLAADRSTEVRIVAVVLR